MVIFISDVRSIPGLEVVTKGSKGPFFMPPFASACLALTFLEANFVGFRISSSQVSTVRGMPILTKDSNSHIFSGSVGSYCEGARVFDGLTDRLRGSSVESDRCPPDSSASLSEVLSACSSSRSRPTIDAGT